MRIFAVTLIALSLLICTVLLVSPLAENILSRFGLTLQEGAGKALIFCLWIAILVFHTRLSGRFLSSKNDNDKQQKS